MAEINISKLRQGNEKLFMQYQQLQKTMALADIKLDLRQTVMKLPQLSDDLSKVFELLEKAYGNEKVQQFVATRLEPKNQMSFDAMNKKLEEVLKESKFSIE